MDGYTLRCNNLRCRTPIETRAIVTTCSHVFCEQCAESLHLINPPPNHPRRCPACDALLSAPDDAVITVLNPSDDYKTSVLSGLSPSTIMEICSRGLAFWNYQVTQEAVYQEHMAKSLTDKYNVLSGELDKVIHDANSEIARLRDKVAVSGTTEEDLRRKNHELMENWKEKCRKLAQVQELYDKLKRRTLISGVRDAAAENVEHAISTPRVRTNTNGYDQAPPQMFGAREAPVFQVPNGQQIPSLRRQRGAEDDDVLMTGVRTGTVNGAGRSRSSCGSINSDEFEPIGQRNRSDLAGNLSRQRNSSYRMETMGGFGGFGIPASSQEHRQRLPPTPVGQAGRPGGFGQVDGQYGMQPLRNPLGQMHSNIGISNGGRRKR